MKNKTFACVMGLVLALSLTACGEEEVIVENTNEEVSVEVQTQEATEAPTETVAETVQRQVQKQRAVPCYRWQLWRSRI